MAPPALSRQLLRVLRARLDLAKAGMTHEIRMHAPRWARAFFVVPARTSVLDSTRMPSLAEKWCAMARSALVGVASLTSLLATVTSHANQFFVPSATGSSRILRVDASTGAYLGQGSVAFAESFYDMTWGPDGYIYGAGIVIGSGIIARFSPVDGAYVGQFVAPGSGGYESGTSNPSRIAFGSDGNLYATTYISSSGVLKFDGKTGAFLGSITSEPKIDLAAGPDGMLYASVNGGIKRYSVVTSTWSSFVANGLPAKALRFGPDDQLYALGTAAIYEYDQNGTLVNATSVANSSFQALRDLTFGPDGKIYLSDQSLRIARLDDKQGLVLFSDLRFLGSSTQAMYSIIYVPEPASAWICMLLCARVHAKRDPRCKHGGRSSASN